MGVLGLVGVMAAACSSSSSGPTNEEVATKYSTNICARYAACSPTLITIAFGDVTACEASTKRSALVAVAAPQTGLTAAKGLECADKIPALSCADLFDGKVPPECTLIKGGIANGTACGESGQCQSGFCAKAVDNTCGSCAIPPTAGQSCANGDCPTGLKCISGTCQAPGTAGSPCNANQPCGLAFTCFNGKCQAAGKVGDACDFQAKTAPACDLFQSGAICQNGKTCEALNIGKTGDTCGFIVNGTDTKYVACGAPSYCAKKSTEQSGVCAARAAEGT
ncbi:MAG: Thiamin-phosphate pyrophosphorylase, partial [Myxococcaceae bacterium]|nr:Thiamin-phosphate pyrophosphorylase [Myxococcaceae bacterium]